MPCRTFDGTICTLPEPRASGLSRLGFTCVAHPSLPIPSMLNMRSKLCRRGAVHLAAVAPLPPPPHECQTLDCDCTSLPPSSAEVHKLLRKSRDRLVARKQQQASKL